MVFTISTAFAAVEGGIKSVFPNPSSDKVTIQFEDLNQTATLEVYDMLGKRFKSLQLSGVTQTSFSVSDLKPGTYFLRLKEGSKTVSSQRLVVTK